MEFNYMFYNNNVKIQYTLEVSKEEAFETLKDSGYITRKEIRKFNKLEEFKFSKALLSILKDLYKKEAMDQFRNLVINNGSRLKTAEEAGE